MPENGGWRAEFSRRFGGERDISSQLSEKVRRAFLVAGQDLRVQTSEDLSKVSVKTLDGLKLTKQDLELILKEAESVMGRGYDTFQNSASGDLNARIEALKKYYRKEAKIRHPDVNQGDPKAAEKFKGLQIAFNLYNELLEENYVPMASEPPQEKEKPKRHSGENAHGHHHEDDHNKPKRDVSPGEATDNPVGTWFETRASNYANMARQARNLVGNVGGVIGTVANKADAAITKFSDTVSDGVESAYFESRFTLLRSRESAVRRLEFDVRQYQEFKQWMNSVGLQSYDLVDLARAMEAFIDPNFTMAEIRGSKLKDYDLQTFFTAFVIFYWDYRNSQKIGSFNMSPKFSDSIGQSGSEFHKAAQIAQKLKDMLKSGDAQGVESDQVVSRQVITMFLDHPRNQGYFDMLLVPAAPKVNQAPIIGGGGPQRSAGAMRGIGSGLPEPEAKSGQDAGSKEQKEPETNKQEKEVLEALRRLGINDVTPVVSPLVEKLLLELSTQNSGQDVREFLEDNVKHLLAAAKQPNGEKYYSGILEAVKKL